MLVQFKTIKTNEKEMYERSLAQAELDRQEDNMGTKLKPLPFTTSKDYLATKVIDMVAVDGWEEATVYFNDKPIACIYALMGGVWTRNLLIAPDKFKAIYEHVHRDSVVSAESFVPKSNV